MLSVARAEAAEAHSLHRYHALVPEESRDAFDIVTSRIGGGMVFATRTGPEGLRSRALAFTEPVTGALVDRVIAFCRTAGSTTGVLQLPVTSLPHDWPLIAADRQLTSGASVVKVAARVGELVHITPDPRVRVVCPEDAGQWAHVLMQGRGIFSDVLATVLARSATDPGFHCYAAWSGPDIIAGTSMYVHGEIATLEPVSVRAGHRGLGTEQALTAALLARAAELHCRWVVVRVGGSSLPLAGLGAAVLHPLYRRQEFRWDACW